jgi:CarD family transcriptional regulator
MPVAAVLTGTTATVQPGEMRSGNICQIAEVVSLLASREQDRGLSTGERKMLENARQILISELALARNYERKQIENMLEKLLA